MLVAESIRYSAAANMYISSPYLDRQVTPLVNASNPNTMSFVARTSRAIEADV